MHIKFCLLLEKLYKSLEQQDINYATNVVLEQQYLAHAINFIT